MPGENTRRDVAAQLREFGRVLREQKWLVALCVILAGFAAAAYSSSQQKIYSSTAKLLLQPGDLGAAIVGTGVGSTDPQRQAATDSQLVSLPAVGQRVAKRLGPLAPATISTSQSGDANIISVDVRDPDPNRAASIANAFASEYIKFRSEANKRRYLLALRTLQTRLDRIPKRKRSSQRTRLRQQAKDLQLLSSLQTGDAQVIQDALPAGAPVSPKPTRDLVLGVIFGAFLGIALAFLRDRLDRRVKNQKEVEEIFPDVPVIGWIPKTRRAAASKLRTSDAFYALRTNLGYLTPNGSFRSLLVTSAMAGEGKSSVAMNLGLVMSGLDEHVLLLDADLRRPALSRRVEADSRVGVSTILAGDTEVDTAVQRRAVDASMNGTGPVPALAGELSLVPSGPLPTSPQLLLTAHALDGLLKGARMASDVLIVDGPPIGAVADMLPVARNVDAVIVVVRLYHSRKDALERLAAQLANAKVTPAGLVLLGAAAERKSYYDYAPAG